MQISGPTTVLFTFISGKTLPAVPTIPLAERWAFPLNRLGETSFFSLQQNAEFREL
jgi:hypothetical protein